MIISQIHYDCTVAGGEILFHWEIHIVIIIVIMEQNAAPLVITVHGKPLLLCS